MRHSDSLAALAAALAKAQAVMAGAKKDSANPAFNSKYADLASVVEAAKVPLSDNGLSYVQTPVTTAEDRIGVETMLLHSSGEWICSEPYFMPVSKANAHGFGSILTYARRYSLAAMLGIAPEDDDANAGAGKEPEKGKPMSTVEFAKHKGAIGAAEDELTLRGAYTAGVMAARAIGDHDAESRFTDLKDERKAQLQQAA